MNLNQIAGILPALVFPAATGFQLWRMYRARSAAGVSAATWTLFGFANVAMYIYAERYTEWQSIVGMLLTAILDFAIVGVAFIAARAAPHERATSKNNSGNARDIAETLTSQANGAEARSTHRALPVIAIGRSVTISNGRAHGALENDPKCQFVRRN